MWVSLNILARIVDGVFIHGFGKIILKPVPIGNRLLPRQGGCDPAPSTGR
jgi:hypothetical protein